MAMRHLRRIQELGKPKALAKEEGAATDGDEEEEDVSASKNAPFNPFDLLSDDEEAEPAPDADGSDREGQPTTAPAVDAATPDAAEATADQPLPKPKPKAAGSGKKAAAKKTAKKKQGGKQQPGAGADDSAEGAKPRAAKGAAADAGVKGLEEDIEAILRELNITPAGPATAASTSTSADARAAGPTANGAAAAATGGGGPAAAAAAGAPSVLCVDVKGLRGDEELRRIFGADVVAAVDKQDRAAAAEARRAGVAARGVPASRRRGLALKRGCLVAPKEHWPACEGGLSMEAAGSEGGVPVFRYVYSPAYKETQARFYRCQASYDPATIAALLQQAPYHVDSLLAMHDLYRHMGENSYAEEMLDRALWVLEAAWHPAFQPAAAACRLDYGVDENKALFGALFRHVQALSRRGCHRASLECCKLLLALEPEDPLGGLCLLDYLAVRAGRYDWLQRFVLQFEGNRSLALLPNFAFALPMAAHRQQQEQQQQQRQPGAGAGAASSASSSSYAAEGAAAAGSAAERSQTGAGASTSSSSSSSPHEQLVGALLLHPVVLPRLVHKLQEKGAAKESYWKELLSRRLFSGASDGGSASLSHLVGLYVERSGELWKPPDLLALLRRAAQEAADVAEGKVAPSNGISAADWRTLARESFPPSAANEYRHLRTADFSDAVNALPREEVEAAVQRGGGGGHAMPQVDEEVLAQIQEQMILEQQRLEAGGGGGGAGGGGGRGPLTDDQLRNTNPLLMLLRSLLPWVNAGQQPDYAAEDGAARAAAAGGGGAGQLPPLPQLEYDEDDGHVEDEEGVVRNVRR